MFREHVAHRFLAFAVRKLLGWAALLRQAEPSLARYTCNDTSQPQDGLVLIKCAVPRSRHWEWIHIRRMDLPLRMLETLPHNDQVEPGRSCRGEHYQVVHNFSFVQEVSGRVKRAAYRALAFARRRLRKRMNIGAAAAAPHVLSVPAGPPSICQPRSRRVFRSQSQETHSLGQVGMSQLRAERHI